MTSVQQGALQTPGASIFYRSCGRRPPVLILAGGDVDADGCDPLRDALAERHRVLTLDRRGLSRSRLEPGAAAADIAAHADDAYRLLAALTDEPAYVFGTSLGGLIGLDLVARYPEQVKMLVAHEAPTAELLPDEERQALAEVLERPLAACPGGHTGWLLRPRAFAARLMQIFAQAERRDWRLGDGVGPRPGGRI